MGVTSTLESKDCQCMDIVLLNLAELNDTAMVFVREVYALLNSELVLSHIQDDIENGMSSAGM